MPVFQADRLEEIATRILVGANVPDADARIVARELSSANLVGHDSHGVIRLMQYVNSIEKGQIQPENRIEVLQEGPSFVLLDAHQAFGQVAANRALELAQAMAKTSGTATALIRNCNHVGRLGAYSQKAALAGFGAMMAVNAPGPGGVAPFGAVDRRLGTNPISMAAPCGENPLVLDMTSSATAEGKVRVAFQKGEEIPEGWIIDAQGNPSTDPADLYATPPGAILPLGGPLGFKGSGLSMMIDVFAGVLSGSGVARNDLPLGANGVWMYLVDISQFLPREEYDRWLESYREHIKSARRRPGVDEVLLPGELEMRRQRERLAQGVDLPEETWRQIRELADRLGVALETL